MKNASRLSLIVALLVALFAGVSSGSAALVSYNSGFQVQNLENQPASITISFIDRQGNTTLTVQDTVAASASPSRTWAATPTMMSRPDSTARSSSPRTRKWQPSPT
jgi:hypothetical protein